MADVFQNGDLIPTTWANKVSKTVTDACGEKTTPAELRVYIDAERTGTADLVQSDLNNHKADSTIHTPAADIVLQAEKGVANGIPTLDGTTKIPATFIPSTGGYAGVYDTQALMVAGAAGHSSGEIFLVTDDPNSSLNGEYTAKITPPVVIGDYYFNSGGIAPHVHNADEVNVVALGVTAEVDSADLHSDIVAVASELVTHEATVDIHYVDAPSDGLEYNRKDATWVQAGTGTGTGDLKSDFSVQMVGTPSLGQDIATKASSEAVFTARLRGYEPGGLLTGTNVNIDSFATNSVYTLINNATGTFPADYYVANTGILWTYRRDATYGMQILMQSGGPTAGDMWSRHMASTGHQPWRRIDNNGFSSVQVTQAQYDALVPDATTIYMIVG